MKVKDIMSTEVISVRPEDSIKTVTELMAKHDLGCIPVTEGGHLLGTVTDRDVALRAVYEPVERVEQIMSIGIISVNPENSVTEAARLMAKKRLRRLPVCNGDMLVGMVTLGDISRVKGFFAETACALGCIYEKN